MRDPVQRKRHHAVPDVVQQVAAAEPALHPFGTVGYLKRIKRKHDLAPRGEKCLMMGIAQNYPSSTFRVLNVNKGEIAIRQNVSWHPEKPEVREDGDQAAASGEGSNTGKQMPQPSPEVNMEMTTAMSPTTQQPERRVELAEGPLEPGVGDGSGPGHESESKGGDPEQQTESDDQPPQ